MNRASGVPLSSVPAGTTLSRSTIAFSTRAPVLITQDCITMELLTMAPVSTTTLRPRMELDTVPLMRQLPETRLLLTREPVSNFAGALSWAFVLIVRSAGNSSEEIVGSSMSMLDLK